VKPAEDPSTLNSADEKIENSPDWSSDQKMNLRHGRLLFSALACFLVLAILPIALALEVPALRGRVNDYAGLLPSTKAQEIEERLAQFEKETGHQIAVLTVPGLEGDALEDFSIRVAENWKIGQKGFDNGAILVIAHKDRKLRIEVGYGLEGVLPDAIASRIIREVIVSRFRENNYSGGIEAGVDAILKAAIGERLPATPRTSSKQPPSNISVFGAVLIMTAIAALFIGMTQRRFTRGTVGGAVAGLFATLGVAPGYGMALWVVALVVGGVLGAMGSRFASNALESQWRGGTRRTRDDWGGHIFHGGLGGGFGSGGFGGGGFSGGGFSGGGGGFGGGGASGSW
jgi:uncharacterized protein